MELGGKRKGVGREGNAKYWGGKVKEVVLRDAGMGIRIVCRLFCLMGLFRDHDTGYWDDALQQSKMAKSMLKTVILGTQTPTCILHIQDSNRIVASLMKKVVT